MTPFVILALPRTGSRMVGRSLSTHSQLPDITHEFRGNEEQFRQHPYVLSNFLRDFMRDVVFVHLYRRDYEAGARSLLTMGYPFDFDIPEHEIESLAAQRREMDAAFREVSDLSVAYEDLTDDGKQIDQLPQWFVDRFCAAVGVEPEPIRVTQLKDRVYLNRVDDVLIDDDVDSPIEFEIEPATKTALFVVDRKPLESLPNKPACRMDADVGDHHLGGCAWNAGRTDYSAIRPGRVALLSWCGFTTDRGPFVMKLTPAMPHRLIVRLAFV